MIRGIALNQERYKNLLDAKETKEWSYINEFIPKNVYDKYAHYVGGIEPINIIIISMRFIYKKSLREIADMLEYSAPRIRQIEYNTCARLVRKKLIGELAKIDKELSDKVVSFYIDKFAQTENIPSIIWSNPGNGYMLSCLTYISTES